MNYEYEAKALISKQDYDKLILTNKIDSSVKQTNVYFETEDGWFKKNKSALRIRQIDSKPTVLTIKIEIDEGNIEHDYELSAEQTHILLTEFKLPNFDFPIKFPNLSQKYLIVTTRKTFLFEGFTIELDQTSFGNFIDYEVEIEASTLQIANDKLDNLAQQYQLELKKSAPKIARYFIYNQEKDR